MPSRRRTVQKRPLINFLDLGSGSFAERGWGLGERRKDRPGKARGRIVSVDKNKGVLADGRGRLRGQPHHSFRETDVFEMLRKQRANSVKVANDDAFIEEVVLSDFKKNKLVHGLSQAVEIVRQKLRPYFRGVFRVVIPNGRFGITMNGVIKNIVKGELERAGFQILSERPLTVSEMREGPSKYLRDFLESRDLARLSIRKLRMYEPETLIELGHEPTVTSEELENYYRLSCKKPRRKKA
jgi:hypothetical protein